MEKGYRLCHSSFRSHLRCDSTSGLARRAKERAGKTDQAVRQARAMIALNSMRRKAAREGYLSDDEIEMLIDEARSEG